MSCANWGALPTEQRDLLYYSNADFRFVGNKVCEVGDWGESKGLRRDVRTLWLWKEDQNCPMSFFLIATWAQDHGTYLYPWEVSIYSSNDESHYFPLDILPSHWSHISNKIPWILSYLLRYLSFKLIKKWGAKTGISETGNLGSFGGFPAMLGTHQQSLLSKN